MTAGTVTAAPGRGLNILLWVLQVLLAGLFAFAAIPKLAGTQKEVVEGFARFGLGPWFRVFIGAAELAGAVGLMIPRLCGLAALGLALIMAGAVFTQLFIFPPPILALLPGTVLVLLLLIVWVRRDGIAGLFRR